MDFFPSVRHFSETAPNMKLLGSSAIAIVVLYFADKILANGKFADAAFTMIRNAARSLGLH
jgi:hypothetical protein